MPNEGDFSAIFEPVTRRILSAYIGEPNRHLSTKSELRYGSKGSVSVDLTKGQWFDHEEGIGGGVIALLKSYEGLDKGDAVQWLVDEGYLEDRKQERSKAEKAAADAGGMPDFLEHKPIAVYEYTDEKGSLAYQVLKFPKDARNRFMQRRPHPRYPKQWVWKLTAGRFTKFDNNWWIAKPTHKGKQEDLPEATRYLYRLQQVRAAVRAGKPVLLVEGEKDADTLDAWGLTATTNVGGAKYWTEAFTKELEGADVVLLNDNDAAGRNRVSLIGSALKPVAKRVRHLDLAKHWPDMPEKKDVTDWRDEAGGTAETFAELLEKAPIWRPQRPQSTFNAFTWGDLDTPTPDNDYLIDDWLTQRGRSVIGGPSGSGKSFLAIHAAMCIARGVPFFDNHVEKGAVIYQAGEGGLGIKRRLLAYRSHFEVPTSEDIPLVMLPGKVDLFARALDGKSDTEKFIEEARAWEVVMGRRPAAVFFDTLSTATVGADENSGKDMSIVLGNIATIEEALRCHVCLVHHMNADGKKLRGHTSIHANVDQVIQVNNDPETKIRTAKLVKQKDGEDGLDLTFSLAQVVVGHDAKTERPKTSCVVLSVSEKEELKERQKREGLSPRPTEASLLQRLFEATRRYGRLVVDEHDRDPDGKPYPTRAIGHTVVDWRTLADVAVERDVAEEDKAKARDRFKKQWQRNTEFLLKAGIIEADRPYVWWTGKPIRGFPDTFPKKHETQQSAEQTLSLGMQDVMGMDDPEIPF